MSHAEKVRKKHERRLARRKGRAEVAEEATEAPEEPVDPGPEPQDLGEDGAATTE